MGLSERTFMDNILDRIFFDAPTDGTGGGSGDPGTPPETFTKEQMEQIVSGRVSRLKSENEELKKKASEQDTAIAALKASVQELQNNRNPAEPPPGDDDVRGQFEIFKKQTQTQIDTLNSNLEAANRTAADERARREGMERDNLVTAALGEAGCRPDAIAMGMAFFASSIVRTETDGEWVFNLKDNGGTVSVVDGIKAELPDFMKSPTLPGGGSGTTTGSKGAESKAKLETAEKELVELDKRARTSNQQADRLAYRKKKREVEGLRSQLTS